MATELHDKLEQLEHHLNKQGDDPITKFYKANDGTIEQLQHTEDLFLKTLRMEVVIEKEGGEARAKDTEKLLADHLNADMGGERLNSSKEAAKEYHDSVDSAYEEIFPSGRAR